MRSKFSVEITSLADAKLSLLRGGAIQLYRVQKSGGSVLAAVPVSGDSCGALKQLRYEYDIRAALDHGFALCPVRFITYNGGPALLLQDPRGQMLSDLCGVALHVEQFLRVAIKAALALASAHAVELIHGALAPGNIMLHRKYNRAWLTGFRAVNVSPTAHSATGSFLSQIDPDLLHYTAPEATGRVNRSIDCRTDLYSLGCIFHHLLTGVVPFPGLTIPEEVHAHIALQPQDQGALYKALPKRLISILLRLMAKEPEERYQSAGDVITDLLACGEKGVLNVPLTKSAHTKSMLAAPDKLLHRDREIASLRKAVLRATIGESTRMILLEGPAGIGKTTLIQHLRKQLIDVQHEFAIGKCEQSEGGTPYASLTRALRYLQRGILGYSPHEFKQIQTRIKDALAGEASIVAAIFPMLTPVLGVFEHCPAVSVHAEKPRFLRAMSKLLGALATRGRPLILFLDDLQWADENTLEVLAYSVRQPTNGHILFVSAVRSNEVNLGHLLAETFPNDEFLERFPLTALAQEETKGLLEAFLNGNIALNDELARLIHIHTGGNPLFAIQFLRSLIDENILHYDESSREWHANLSVVADKGAGSNVVDLLAGKIQAMCGDTSEVMRCMALLAEPASAQTLAAAMQLSETEIKNRLCEAFESQFVHLEDDRYTFSHDRVREAVFHGMSHRERQEGHLDIGRKLVEIRSDDDAPVSVFVIAHQLNMAMQSVETSDDRHSFALVNLEAARLAKEATAYASATSYLSNARKFVRDGAGNESVRALIELRLGECEFLRMETSRAQRRLRRVRAELLNDKNKAELARLRVAVHVALDQPKLALEIGLRYLAEETGIAVPLSPTDEDVNAEHESFELLYSGRSINDLMAVHLIQDKTIGYAMDVLADLKPAALFTSLNLKDVIILRMACLSLKYGNCDASCYAYVCLSLVLGARYGDHRTASLFGEVAMRLPRERGLVRFQGRVQMCYGALTLPWTGPLTSARQHIVESIRLTTQQGDMTFAIYSRRHLASNLLFCGAPLSDAQSVVEEGVMLARQANFAIVIDALVAQAWLIQSLRGGPVDVGTADSCCDYSSLLHDSLSGRFFRDIAAFAFWTHRLQVAYLFRDFATAMRAEENASRIAWSSRSFLEIVEFNFYSALLRIAIGQQSVAEERVAHLRLASERLSTLASWSKACPVNFLSREKLVRGELAYAQFRFQDAQDFYEGAIQLSVESGALQLQALSCELAGRFCASRRWHTAEQGYIKRAWNAYSCWGAEAKLSRLEQEFAYIKPMPGMERIFAHPSSEHQFDARAVLRAAQALSSEMSLVKLIHVLVDNALQYAGADRAVLCLVSDGILKVAAQARFSASNVEVNIESEVASLDILPTSIAYSTLRTKESLVLHDAREDPHYGRDAYIVGRQSRSIMCVPLIKHGTLSGLLYMENSLMAGIFTVDRLQMLEVLASQAAISLENARLYEDLEAENHMREATESNLRETQGKLDKVAKLTAMDELVASIVHEVSQPLSAVGTCARAALRWLDRDVPELQEARAMLNQISDDSVRAANIVTSLRAMAKKAPPRFGNMDIHEAIREVLGLARGQLVNGVVIVRGNFDSGCLRVRGDRILLQQVIMNLVVNACEALSTVVNGEKIIDVETQLAEDNVLWVSVADTGPGITDKVAATLFDSFVTTKDSGMGMGLSICKSIIEAHGGHMEAHSGIRRGACFRFSVPQLTAGWAVLDAQ
jgi:predicted ATPase/signal transduction histidine kinase